jgi:hypothetical protein
MVLLLNLFVLIALWAIDSVLAPSWTLAGTVLFSAAPIGSVLRRRRGRPRKFAGPSRAITLTLPENVIDRLSQIDRDIGKAIVSLANQRATKHDRAAADLSVFGRQAVITVQPTPLLARLGIELVPLPDGRALIALDKPTSVADLELLVFDLLDDAQLAVADRRIVEGIGSILREARRSDEVALQQRSIIVIETHGNGRRRPRNPVTNR